MATVVHIDVPAEDTERAKTFYSSMFGWKFTNVPEFRINLFTSTNLDGTPGVGGGLGKRTEPSQRMMNYFGVQSIDAAMAQVKELGGRVVSEKITVPGNGYFVNCEDTEGNSFGLWEEDPKAK